MLFCVVCIALKPICLDVFEWKSINIIDIITLKKSKSKEFISIKEVKDFPEIVAIQFCVVYSRLLLYYFKGPVCHGLDYVVVY